MRIFFIGEGRLGNQIFQYAALCSIAPPGTKILAIGLEDLHRPPVRSARPADHLASRRQVAQAVRKIHPRAVGVAAAGSRPWG